MQISSFSKQSLLESLTNQQNTLYELYNKINNNQKYTNISENPIDAADIVRVNKQLNEIETYASNVEKAITQINAQDSAFSTIHDKLQRINDLAIQAANGSSGVDGVKACQSEIEELKKTIVSMANTQYDDKYIFAGTNVTTQPFTYDETTGSITYSGTKDASSIGYERYLEVSDGDYVNLNSAGDKIFGEYDAANPDDATKSYGLFKVLGDLSAALEAGDQNAIREQITPLQDSMQDISQIQATHSSTVTRLNMTTQMLEDTKLTLSSRKAELSDIDTTTAISELVQQNYALQASMQAYSMLSNQSLLDYI